MSSKETLKMEEVSEVSHHTSETEDSRNRPGSKSSGCHVTVVQGFILTFFALVIALLVGVIVHFAGQGKTVACTCTYPPPPPINEEQQWRECLDLSAKKNICLNAPHCQKDETASTSTTAAATSTTAAATSTTSTPKPEPVDNDVRLPLKVVPRHYDVRLRPNIYSNDTDMFSFSGNVSIYMMCVKATNVITLHTNKLVIDGDIQLLTTSHNIQAPMVQEWTEDKKKQFLKVHLAGKLTVGTEYILKINFHAPLKADLAGFYWSSYKAGTKTKYLATTQMEPTDARRSFPCFDEPAIKATFSVTLLRKNSMKTLANMNMLRTDPMTEGWVADVYNKTVKMSTYLLAFIVCDFDYTEGVTKSGTKFRIWSRPEAVNQTAYALEKGIATIEFFERYFDIPFPLPKQDMIAVPDFGAGAMENWGLIIYREDALLYDPNHSSARDKELVAKVVVHELAHQWFGNLVSPAWWDDLWLNEGFASYMEYVGIDHIEPSWNIHDKFASNVIGAVFKSDNTRISHPLYVPVNHPDEIYEIFDLISYYKGAAVIRMMNFFLGETTFTTGLTNYLRKFAYSNANHTDLWIALGEQAATDGKTVDVPDVMNTWVRQMGYPVVKIERKGATALVTQQRFLSDPSDTTPDKYPSPYNYTWEVPLTYVDDNNILWNNHSITWLRRSQKSVSITVNAGSKWIIGNTGQYGYYRVNYDQANWNALIQQLQDDHTVIPPNTRVQIIDDATNLGSAGYLDELTGLRATMYLSNEKHYLPWKTALVTLNFYERMFMFTEYYGSYKSYMVNLVKPAFDEVGLNYAGNSESQNERDRRVLVAGTACKYGYGPCKNQVTGLFKDWMRQPANDTIIKLDVKFTVYCNAIRYGGVEEWDFLYNKYKTTNVAAEATRILVAVTCSREPWIINRLLYYTLDPEEIRRQNAFYVVRDLTHNPVGKQLAWDFFRAKWTMIKEKMGLYLASYLIRYMTSGFNTEFELQELQDFQSPYSEISPGATSYDTAVKNIEFNMKWTKQKKDTVGQWFVKNA